MRILLPSRPVFTMVACLLLAGFLTVGCGGGSDSSASAGATTIETSSESKAEFIASAENVCKKHQQKMRAQVLTVLKEVEQGQSSSGSPQAAQRRLVLVVVVPEFESEAEELRALGAPGGEEKRVEAMIVAIEKSAAEARKNPQTYLSGEKFAKADDLARKFGLLACGNFSS